MPDEQMVKVPKDQWHRLLSERDNARAEVERLRDENHRLRQGKPSNGFPWPCPADLEAAAAAIARKREAVAERTRINAVIDPPPEPPPLTDEQIVLEVVWSLRYDRTPPSSSTDPRPKETPDA